MNTANACCCLLASQAYDGHMNMVLSEVEEQISLLEIDEASNQQKIKVRWVKSSFDKVP